MTLTSYGFTSKKFSDAITKKVRWKQKSRIQDSTHYCTLYVVIRSSSLHKIIQLLSTPKFKICRQGCYNKYASSCRCQWITTSFAVGKSTSYSCRALVFTAKRMQPSGCGSNLPIPAWLGSVEIPHWTLELTWHLTGSLQTPTSDRIPIEKINIVYVEFNLCPMTWWTGFQGLLQFGLSM